MAGNYPDVPSWRMAYDRDGTQAFWINQSNEVTALTATQTRVMNDETGTTEFTAPMKSLVFIFPELRDFDGIFIDAQQLYSRPLDQGDGITISVSPTSTNGVDGTWEEVISQYTPPILTQPNYRAEIRSATALGIKAVKLGFHYTWNPEVSTVHLYGEIAPGQNPNRLALWHPTLNQRIQPAHFDWGNTPRSSSADKQFRVKNLSASLTAVSPRVAMDALTDTSPSVPGQHSISLDASTFGSQQTLPNLAPGALSQPITLRRVTPTNAVLSLWSFRIFCEAQSWA